MKRAHLIPGQTFAEPSKPLLRGPHVCFIRNRLADFFSQSEDQDRLAKEAEVAGVFGEVFGKWVFWGFQVIGAWVLIGRGAFLICHRGEEGGLGDSTETVDCHHLPRRELRGIILLSFW